MIRNLDLVRKILLEIESESGGFSSKSLELEGFSKDEIEYHITIMLEAGLIQGASHNRSGHYYPLIIPSRLTWAGHDFLDACRDEGRWKEAKEIFIKAGGVTFDVAKEVLVRLMLSGISQYLSGGVRGG